MSSTSDLTRSPDKSPALLRVTQVLFFLNSAIWLSISAWSVFRIASNGEANLISSVVVAVLMVGNAAAFLAIGVGLKSGLLGFGARPFFFLGFIVLSVNILLTFTDQFGILDLATLVVDIIAVFMLVIVYRQWFLHSKNIKKTESL